MTLPSPSGIAAGETGDPAQVVPPDPVADPAPPVTGDAGGASSPLPLPARHSEHRCCILQGGTPKRRATTPATATPAVADLLAGVAGLLERAGDGEPGEPLNRQAAGLCRKAGTDPEAIPAWIEEGRRRGAAARMPPAGGLRGG